MCTRRGAQQSDVSTFRQLRSGLTLIELLVVVSIIGLLVALLLPAVQMARESGRRTECANHLKQIGLGFQLHQDSLKAFPTGGIFVAGPFSWKRTWAPRQQVSPTGKPESLELQSWCWAYQILPFVEEQLLYDTRDDRSLIQAAISLLLCPTRGVKQIVPTDGAERCGLLPPDLPRGRTDYAANGGVPPEVSDECLGRCGEPGCTCGDTRDSQNGAVTEGTVIGDANYNGRAIGARRFTDGLSKTIAAGEKQLVGDIGSCQHDDNEGWITGWDWDSIRWGHVTPAPDKLLSSEGGSTRFGSPHSSVFQVVFCDGAVRSLRYEIDGRAFSYLSIRDDGNTPDLN